MADQLLANELTAEQHAEMRATCPVSRLSDGTWFLARYDDVVAGAQDVHTFRASFRAAGVVVPDEEQFVNEIPEPRHGHVRRIINSAIAGHRLTSVEPFARQLCEDLLDGLRERGVQGDAIDLVDEFITPVPNNVIAHLLGAKPDEYRLWSAWSDELVQGTYPVQYRNERGVGLAGAHPEFTAYVDALIADRLAEPRDDFVTRLVTREVDGKPLTPIEARAQLIFLFISGNETTRHLIGNLLHRLAADPEMFAELRAERSLIPNMVEESLRHDPPVRFLLRECTRDTDVLGERFAGADKVAFGLESANRDEGVFADPDDFRLDRPDPRRHLAFGGGPHVCPGAQLARLEGRVALETLLDRASGMRLAEGYEYERVPVFWAHGPRTLPVHIDWL